MKSNITLIGMPASGKSTIGVLLAKRLGYSFVDVDIVIQEETGKLLKEIIEEQGTEGFLKVEEEINSRLDVTRSVIAAGRKCHLRTGCNGAFKENKHNGLLKTGLSGTGTASGRFEGQRCRLKKRNDTDGSVPGARPSV